MKNKTNDKEGKFPGYPHYGKKDDIYKNAEELNSDIEDVGKDEIMKNNHKKEDTTIPNDFLAEQPVPDDLLKDVENNTQDEYDITKDDLIALSSLDDEVDDPENKDGINKDRVYPLDMTAEDLDIPGVEEDDLNEEIGEEDEENNFYSLPDDQDK
ncbi:MAG: hypothetical protein ACHQFW_05815 [Chitinophagales bacterium]